MFFVLALSLMVALPLFASGVTEKGTYFKELDLNTATLEEMESAWEYSVDTYTNQRTTLRTAMDDAMEKRDIEGYVEMRSLYNSLEYPVITKEQTETLKERILNTENQEDKDALASFVYENSVFYRPTLVFDYSVDNGYYTRSYKKALSTLPGTVVTAPEVKGDGVFLGWSLDGETVSYKSGEEIIMPYSDTVLYGVFSSGISFNDEITGNNFIFRVTQDALQFTFCSFLHFLANFRIRSRLCRLYCQINYGNRWRRNTERHTRQFTLNLGQYQTNRFSSTGR